jgi:glycosyltransferase involved in cell wall biosynthesis
VILDIAWRLGRLRATTERGWLYLRREGLMRTGIRATQRFGERARTGTPGGAVPVTPATPATRRARDDNRPRLLVIDALMPDPMRDSGSLRLCRVLQVLADMGWAVDFMPDTLRADASDRAPLEIAGVGVLCRPRVRSLATWLRREGASLSAVMVCRHYVANAHVRLIREHAPSARILFDTVDLHYVRELRAARLLGDRVHLRRALRTRRREWDLIRHCDTTFVVSPVEKRRLQQAVPQADIRVLSNIHRAYPDSPGFELRHDLVFIGGWSHPPNRDALCWLTEAIMPRIRERLPDAMLHLVGDMPQHERARLQGPGIRIHGRVPDLTPLMHHARVALAPLRYGAGVKGKINTAMSHGIPVVATSLAVEGMYLIDERDVLVADGAAAFAAAVARVYQDRELWQTLADGGMQNVRRYFSFDAARRCLESALTPSAEHAERG